MHAQSLKWGIDFDEAQTRQTAKNDESSRSHAFFIVEIKTDEGRR